MFISRERDCRMGDHALAVYFGIIPIFAPYFDGIIPLFILYFDGIIPLFEG